MKLRIFSAEWCSTCKPYKARLESSGIAFENVDIDSDEGQSLGPKNNIRSLPTTQLLDDDGKVVKTYIGAQSPATLTADMNQAA